MTLVVLPRQIIVDANGTPRIGAKLSVYDAGTTTTRTVYTTKDYTTVLEQPVESLGSGLFPAIYVNPTGGHYKLVITDSSDVPLYTEDNIPAQTQAADLDLAGVATSSQTIPILNSLARTSAEITAAVTPSNYSYPPGDVRRYGAVLNGVTSDHLAVTAAGNQAAAGGAPVFFPFSASGLATSEALVIPANAPVNAHPGALVTYTGSLDVAILTCGTAVTPSVQLQYTLPRVRRGSQSAWGSEDCIGVRLMNINRCSVYVPEVTNCTIGAQLIGQSMACAGNEITMGLILNNKVAVDLTNDDDSGIGYCNSNRLYAGYLTNDTGVNPTLARYGVRINSLSSTKYYNNDLSFDGLTIELNTAGSGVAMPILVSYGVQNRFRNIRDELNDTVCMRCENDSYRNIVETNYPTGSVQNAGTYRDNFVLGLDKWTQNAYAPSWQSPAVHRSGNEYDGSGAAYVAGMSIMGSASGAILRAASGLAFTDNYVNYDSTRAVGVLVDTRSVDAKRWTLRRDVESANGGRFHVACFDATMTQLTSAGGAHPYALSDVTTPLSYTTSFGGAYQTGGDGANPIFLALKDEVKFAWIGVVGGSAPARLRSIGLQCLDGGAITAFQGFTDGSVRHYNNSSGFATSAPATDIGVLYVVGQMILKANAAAGALPGWVCTTAGAGGTAVFKAMANLAA